MKQPPLLPEETLHRVLRVANFDGMSVMAVAGMLALASASAKDYSGAAVGLLVAAAGAFELHGVGLLRAGERRGMNWLIASQPYLATVLLCYCGLRLMAPDLTLLREAITPELKNSLEEAGRDEEAFLRSMYVAMYVALGVATLIYQGLMTAYYWRRRNAVALAVEGVDEIRDL